MGRLTKDGVQEFKPIDMILAAVDKVNLSHKKSKRSFDSETDEIHCLSKE